MNANLAAHLLVKFVLPASRWQCQEHFHMKHVDRSTNMGIYGWISLDTVTISARAHVPQGCQPSAVVAAQGVQGLPMLWFVKAPSDA